MAALPGEHPMLHLLHRLFGRRRDDEARELRSRALAARRHLDQATAEVRDLTEHWPHGEIVFVPLATKDFADTLDVPPWWERGSGGR